MEKRNGKKSMRGYFLAVFSVIVVFIVGIGAKQASAAGYADATILPLNGAWGEEHWLTEEDQEQWYKLIIPSDGKLTYKMMGYTRVNCELYDEVCSRRFHDWHVSGSETSPDTGTASAVLSKGTYYMKITPYWGSLGKYKLNASFLSFHTNDDYADSYDSPKQISLGTVITGAITPTDTEDWYCINIPANGYYHVKITSFCSCLYNELYNFDLSKSIASHTLGGSESSPDTREYDKVLSPGKYYLKINGGWQPGRGKYTLQINALSQSNCDHDYENTYVDPSYTHRGYTLHVCSKCGHSYEDNYKSKYTLSSPSLYTAYAGKKKATVSWSYVSSASGYEVSYKLKNKTKIVNVKGNSKTKKTIKRLKPKKKYAIRVRAYRREGAAIAYSSWSSKRSVKVR